MARTVLMSSPHSVPAQPAPASFSTRTTPAYASPTTNSRLSLSARVRDSRQPPTSNAALAKSMRDLQKREFAILPRLFRPGTTSPLKLCLKGVNSDAGNLLSINPVAQPSTLSTSSADLAMTNKRTRRRVPRTQPYSRSRQRHGGIDKPNPAYPHANPNPPPNVAVRLDEHVPEPSPPAPTTAAHA
ncbi:hypothetical protein HMN09_01233700 [Mycena chlorophos]|uniref:Uncharacterized protein n=1 Tax=Mycena chlorophos TaxID=658473 RepID=A0A8H6S2W4_MYCCL|nr:hypothetical protein HMN09_01233700 [Mycena chlorophos]